MELHQALHQTPGSVHRAGGPFDGALRRGSGQAQNRGWGGGRELSPSDGTGNSQFAICTRRWKPAPTTGALWRRCWACRRRMWNWGRIWWRMGDLKRGWMGGRSGGRGQICSIESRLMRLLLLEGLTNCSPLRGSERHEWMAFGCSNKKERAQHEQGSGNGTK